MQQGFWNVGIRKRMKATLRASAAVAAVALAFTAAPLTGYAVRIEPAAQEGVTSNIFGSAGSESEFYRQISQTITQGQESLTITLDGQPTQLTGRYENGTAVIPVAAVPRPWAMR